MKQTNSNPEISAFPQKDNFKGNYLQVGKFLLKNLDGDNQCWSTDTDDYDIEEKDEDEIDKTTSHIENIGNGKEEMEDIQDSSDYEDSDVEQKEQLEKDHKLELKESIIDNLYEKSLVKLLFEHDLFSKFQGEIDQLESIFYHATIWNDYINHIKLDKVLKEYKDDFNEFVD